MPENAEAPLACHGRLKPGLRGLFAGLSGKLLLLTVVFVMLAEVLIFVPSISTMRLRWLQDRLNTAAAAGIVIDGLQVSDLPRGLQDDTLVATGTRAIVLRKDGTSRLLAASDMPDAVDGQYNLAETTSWGSICDALDTLVFGGNRIIRVYGPIGDSAMTIELVMSDASLRRAMLTYSGNMLAVSVLISLITATLIFFAINRLLIRPIRGLTLSMQDFSQAPEDPARIMAAGPGRDELALAGQHLAAMQAHLQRTLKQQKNLADLGLAVSKINHDMRNILASAQLISDRLRQVKDPTVQAFAPKLLRTLDRAVSYSEGVLAYGRTQEPPPKRRRLRLRQLVDDVHGLLDPHDGIEFVNAVEPGFEIDADADQLFRVLTNLSRNAVQAMAGDTESAVVRRLTISAERAGSVCRILVTDTGPGLPPKARENLFAAFRGSARSGGTGLGLAIAQELARAHGGGVELVESVGGRTVFSVTIPDQPVRLDHARGLRRPA